MTGVTQLGYLGIGVRDVDEWERFATGVLGYKLTAGAATGPFSSGWTSTTIDS